MAASYLREIVSRRAQDKKIELQGPENDFISSLDRKLDHELDRDGDKAFVGAMDELRKKLGGKFKDDDFKYIANEVYYKLHKRFYH
jgi:hypothetical protein